MPVAFIEPAASSPAFAGSAVPPVHPGQVLARLDYAIRGPLGISRAAVLHARAGAIAAELPVGASFDDAVTAAHQLSAAGTASDGIHRLETVPATAILQARDGRLWLTGLTANHRGAVAPVFVDGTFADRVTLALQASRKRPELLGIAGQTLLLDLLSTGAAVAPYDGQNAHGDFPEPAPAPVAPDSR